MTHGQEDRGFPEAGYVEVRRREESVKAQDDAIKTKAQWSMATKRQDYGHAQWDAEAVDSALGKVKAQIRARAEHPLQAVQNLFKHKKTCYWAWKETMRSTLPCLRWKFGDCKEGVFAINGELRPRYGIDCINGAAKTPEH